MIELARDLEQYRDVETFEEYELTSCIAYEMAIRNNEVIGIIKHKINGINDPFMLEQYFFSAIDLPSMYLEYHFFNRSELETFIKIQHEVKRRIMFERFDTAHKGFKISNEVERLQPNDLNHNDDLDGFSKPCIFQNFSRPLLRSPSKTDKTIDISDFNFALPKNELIAYIMRIKETYDQSHSIIKAPIEVVLEKLVESDFDKKKGFSASDWADALFIYDYWKMYDDVQFDLEIIAGIKIELNEYHRNNGSTWRKYKGDPAADYLSDSTIRGYRKMMIDYIDNLRYKELITGISSQNL